MTTGDDVYRKIKRKLKDVRSSYKAVTREVNAIDRQIGQNIKEREDTFEELATKYFPNLQDETVDELKNTIPDLHGTARKTLNEKTERREELASLANRSNIKKDDLEIEIENIDSQLEQKAQERERAVHSINETLQSNSEYVTITNQVETLDARLTRNKARIDDFNEFSKQETKKYQDDSIFMYLVNRNFGTDEYKEVPIIANIDSMLANKIDFTDKIKKYNYLKLMPGLIQNEFEKRINRYKELEKGMLEIKTKTEEQFGLPAILKDGKKLTEEKEDALQKLDEEIEKYDNYLDEIEVLDNNDQGVYHRDFIRSLEKYLKGKKIGELFEIASKTEEKTDDNLVTKIYNLNSDLIDLERDAEIARGKQGKLGSVVSGIEKIKKHFTYNDYESSRSRFESGLYIDTLLDDFILGKTSVRNIKSKLDRKQYFKPIKTYSSSSSSSSSWGNYGSGGSIFSGGSSSSSSSSGGFSSTGGFSSGGGGFSSNGGF